MFLDGNQQILNTTLISACDTIKVSYVSNGRFSDVVRGYVVSYVSNGCYEAGWGLVGKEMFKSSQKSYSISYSWAQSQLYSAPTLPAIEGGNLKRYTSKTHEYNKQERMLGMCPTLMRCVTHDGCVFGMFGSDTRVMGRFSGCCIVRFRVTPRIR